MTEDFWEVDYLFIAYVMEMPPQCMVDVSIKVEQFIEMANIVDEYLKIAEEFVHPLIDKKELKSDT